MRLVLFPEAKTELDALPPRERFAMDAALEKLKAYGDRLPFPHSSDVKGAGVTLRELRPRAGNSPWRAFYRRVGDAIVVAAIGPEAKSDPRGFRHAVETAIERLEHDPRLVLEIL
jgi:hypothetical protein